MGASPLSQHNIIGSEAFKGRPHIMVYHMRHGIGRRRRRPAVVITLVAVIALLAGAAVAAFALGPLLAQPSSATAATIVDAAQSQMRLQPVETAAQKQNAPQEATR